MFIRTLRSLMRSRCTHTMCRFLTDREKRNRLLSRPCPALLARVHSASVKLSVAMLMLVSFSALGFPEDAVQKNSKSSDSPVENAGIDRFSSDHPAGQVDYVTQIKPLFRERCYSCHGALKQEASLRLDTAAFAKLGGDSGPAIDSASESVNSATGVSSRASSRSLLITRISSADDDVRMPPEGKPLNAEEIALISEWIAHGAEAPENEAPEESPSLHWAFQNLVRPAVPEIPGVSHPIDAFIEQHRVLRRTAALPAADPATLLRRLFLDLTGLPPSADDIVAFRSDPTPEAFDRVVERLLNSPQYGERWGRHWMDVWRYSDWYGRRSVPDVMNSYPMIWRWRDWIVRSLNEDKPYDQMIMEMLAADEINPADDSSLTATGYLVRSWFKWNYEMWKKDLVEHTAKGFLGLTMNCCQCHDHKYDPLTQEEYFQFRAFFEPLELRHDRVEGEPDPGMFRKYVYGQPYGPIKSGMVRVFDEYPDLETYMFSRGDSRLRLEGKPPVSPGIPGILGGHLDLQEKLILPIEAAYPGMKPSIRQEERNRCQIAIDAAVMQLEMANENFAQAPEELIKELADAEVNLQAATADASRRLRDAGSSSEKKVLEGLQSLVLDATTGRRALSHALPEVESLESHGRISWLLEIVQDGHTNLQLALDVEQGATGAFVAFEQGSVKSYLPGSFTEFVAGRYELDRGQNRFKVVLDLILDQDQAALTVTSLIDGKRLVDGMPVAVNGWKPQPNGKRGMFLDCRPGTKAVYDAIAFHQSDGRPVLVFDFELPQYTDGMDVTAAIPGNSIVLPVGDPAERETPQTFTSTVSPWRVTKFCKEPATSRIVSCVSMDPAVRIANARLTAAREGLNRLTLAKVAAKASLAAAEAEQLSLEARILADDHRYSTGLLADDRKDQPDVSAMIVSAWQAEQAAAVARAVAASAAADLAVSDAEAQLSSLRLADGVLSEVVPEPNTQKAAQDDAAKQLQLAEQKRAEAANALVTARAAAAGPPSEYTALSPKYTQTSTGRRSALAKWIASPQNPLTARVAVNHIWLRHFGQAIVESTHDFGRNGSRPTHPELLDWLAAELIESGWSMKHVHRLIVTSQAWQRASMLPVSSRDEFDTSEISMTRDPGNLSYWRFPAVRMQAEVVRDSLLAVSGELDLTMGGHEIDHREGLTSRRRSLYFSHHGEERMEFLELFDAANALDCYKRTVSVQPQQALALTNSELTTVLSRRLAGALWRRVESEYGEPGAAGTLPGGSDRTKLSVRGDDVVNSAALTTAVSGDGFSPESHQDATDGIEDTEPEGVTQSEHKRRNFIRLAFLQVLNRDARDNEVAASLMFLSQQQATLSAVNDPDLNIEVRCRENLIHALMNHNDFVTIR